MHSLIDGVNRFRTNVAPTKVDLFNELATGQSPEVLFVACADSRVDPSLLTQTEPGDLFVCRNAGNIVPPSGSGTDGTVASIEYGVRVLGVSEIVVCGHSDCGAVKGALAPDSVASLPEVKDWLRHAVTPAVTDLRAAIETNVLMQIQNLRTYDFITSAIQSGQLTLSGWVYDIGAAEVRVFDGTSFTTPALESA